MDGTPIKTAFKLRTNSKLQIGYICPVFNASILFSTLIGYKLLNKHKKPLKTLKTSEAEKWVRQNRILRSNKYAFKPLLP